MARNFNSVFAVAMLVAVANAFVTAQDDVPNGLIFMGATKSKQLYISESNLTSDFIQTLSINCPLRFQMSMAAIESAEEFAVVDKFFETTQGNSSDAAYTPGFARLGLIPAHWANNGMRISEFPAAISGPWPSGAGSSPTYAGHNCITIQRRCIRPPGTPIPGCFPAETQFMYTTCTSLQRFICQKLI